jgi:hypothetical protein
MVGYTEVIQDGHRAGQYPEVGLWELVLLFLCHGLTASYSGPEGPVAAETELSCFLAVAGIRKHN